MPGAGAPPPGYGRQEPPRGPDGYGGPTYQQHPGFFDAGPSEHDDYFDEEPPTRKRRFGGCLAVLVALAVVLGGFYVAGDRAIDYVKDQLAPPADYPGPGTDPVSFEVHQGDSVAAVGRNLKEAGVVESVDAFIDAANEKGLSVQVGFYPLKKKMASKDVVEILANPENIDTINVTITEGSRAKAIYKVLAEKTKKKPAEFKKAAEDTEAIGLPDYAKGNVEGYLFPATYAFPPDATPTEMLAMMVDRWEQALGDNDIEARAKQLKCGDGKACTPEQIMTVASLVEAEGRGDDMAKIARVIYNRVENPGTAGQAGFLQIDATVNYALGKSGSTELGGVDVQTVDSPYNTYTNKGLPPGPIGAPGDHAIQAALNPAEGDWYYYVTVNLKTGETKFAKNYDQFLKFKAEYKNYCETESKSC
ncbi:endolytic transglycosylase MltG [Nocardioides sp. KC13]|uniref:Endolytic murein transglycosylase n=1 Tax=Nocardioides turkmenicus TaxID=2711220 RepID=A0A6M1R0P3_9ACTN|nr:endolytic transglycosylase MltG [Nocardioides sp. KC13]NGN93814.1 endolytic transglycosylase MltG [Nocardioides sp. KC13]